MCFVLLLLAQICRVVLGFFFSSRRRHTIWNCDWSSDVCSSDLQRAGNGRQMKQAAGGETDEDEPHDLRVGDQVAAWRAGRPAGGDEERPGYEARREQKGSDRYAG